MILSAPTERHSLTGIMTAPTPEGVRGMGFQDRGRALGRTGPPLATFNVSDIDIYQTKRKSLFPEANASICEPA
jgi:hypothetical protein